MSNQLQQIVATVLNVATDDVSDESGPHTIPEWNSLAHVAMVAAVEEEFNVLFEMEEIVGIKTVGDLSLLLKAKGGPG